MKEIWLTCSGIFCHVALSWGQYQVGRMGYTFTDPSRNNRKIQTEVYYPANENGIWQPMVKEGFPMVLFAPAQNLSDRDYHYLGEAWARSGFITVFCQAAGGKKTDVEAYAHDLVFVNREIKRISRLENSDWYHRYNFRTALVGHAAGGGMTLLAASYAPEEFVTVITMAAMETTPSAISASAGVNIPLLVISGDRDSVARETVHQLPMYENAASTCKYMVTLAYCSHCGYTENSSVCGLRELKWLSSYTSEFIPQNLWDLTYAWLNRYMNNEVNAFSNHISKMSAYYANVRHSCK